MRRRVLFPLLLVSAGLGGCLGEGAENPSHPLHGKWYSKLGVFGPPFGRYRFTEKEYRPDGRVIFRDQYFHTDTSIGRLVLDSIHNWDKHIEYALDGDIVTEYYYDPLNDTLMSTGYFQNTIRGDSLQQRHCSIYAGKGPGLEGRWETQVANTFGRFRVVMEFRGGMRYDTSFSAVRPPVAQEPVAYRLLDDSTFVQGDGAFQPPDTLGYRIRNGRLILLEDSYMIWMFREPPAIP